LAFDALFGGARKVSTGSQVFARLENFNGNDSTLAIEIKHDTIRYFLALDNVRIGKAHVECVSLGII